MNHFELLGLPPSVDLDVATVERRHRELSLEFHPDRHAGADARTRLVLLEKTTALNDAVKVLKDRVRRAFYLLKLHGVDLDKDDTLAHRTLPHDFLEQVLERREALEEARARKDAALARKMGDEVQAMSRAALEDAEGALRALLANPGDAGARDRAAAQLSRVRYFTRFLEEVDAIEEEALGG